MKRLFLMIAVAGTLGGLFADELDPLEKLALTDCRYVVTTATSRIEVLDALEAQREMASKTLEAARQREAFRKANLERAKLFESAPDLIRENLTRQGWRFNENDFSTAWTKSCVSTSSYYVAHIQSSRMVSLWEERLRLCERNLERARGRREPLRPPAFPIYRPKKTGSDWMLLWNEIRGLITEIEKNGKVLIRLASPFREDLILASGTDRLADEIGWSGIERNKDQEVIEALSPTALPNGLHLNSPDRWPPNAAPGWISDFLDGEVMMVIYRADTFNRTALPLFYQFRPAFQKPENVLGVIRSPVDPFENF